MAVSRPRRPMGHNHRRCHGRMQDGSGGWIVVSAKAWHVGVHGSQSARWITRSYPASIAFAIQRRRSYGREGVRWWDRAEEVSHFQTWEEHHRSVGGSGKKGPFRAKRPSRGTIPRVDPAGGL